MAATRRRTVKEAVSDDPEGVKIPLPSLPRLDTTRYTPVLVVLLIVAAFFLGSLYTKVQYLEKGTQTTGGTDLAANQTQSAQQLGNQQGVQAPSSAPQKVNVTTGDFPIKGNKDAKVTVVEWADVRCPFCEQFFKNVEPSIIKDYVDTGKVQFAWRDYAFLGPASTLGGQAVYCASKQNKFWEMHDYLYENQPDESDTSMYTNDNLTQIAGQLGMDTNQFSTCLTSQEAQKQVADDLAAGQKAGVNGTPTTFVNGVPIVGAVPYTQIKQAIDDALKNAK